jgi:hypothetical protein
VAYWLVALDYRTGAEVGRVQVAASFFRSDGTPVPFVAKNQNDRTAILLDHGWLYIAFAMRFREEIIEYHGWVIRYRTPNLTHDGTFCTSRDATVPTAPFTSHTAQGGGIWQGGGGLASDPDGNVYFLTGNARADHAHYSYGDSFVKLTPAAGSLVPTAFVPSRPPGSTDPNDPDDPQVLEKNDADLGAGGALSIPGSSLVIGGGKTGLMYLLDRQTMKLVQKVTAATNQYNPSARAQGWDIGPHLHGSPTFWSGPERLGYLYVWGEKDVLRQYRFDEASGRFQEPALHQGPVRALPDTMPGGMISLSANGAAAGTGIVWATLPTDNRNAPGVNAFPAHLYAFDAETLRHLWDIGIPSLGKWLPPTIASGTVFIGTSSNQLIAYELGSQRHTPARQWTPHQPQGSFNPIPLSQRYDDEESIHALAALALTQIAPPPGHGRGLVLEGDGEHHYEAGETSGGQDKLVWELRYITANLSVAGAAVPDEQRQAATVWLSPEQIWSASDGSTATGEVVKEFPAPGKTDAPWLLYRVTDASGGGILSGVRYVQRIFTIGGLPSPYRPHRPGEVLRVPYHAQYLLYH